MLLEFHLARYVIKKLKLIFFLTLVLEYSRMVDYTITVLDITKKGLTKLPVDIDNLPPNLKKIDCRNSKITSLDNLPPNLIELYCSYNQITTI